MNQGKVGAPYKFPESYVLFAALLYEFFGLLYRQLEGVLRKLGGFLPELKALDYTSLWHRFEGLEIEIPESAESVVAAVDATGVKVTNRGEWMRKYHKGRRRGWIKVHVAVDAESKELLSIEVTDEKTGDSEVFEELIEDLELEDCLAAGAYDSEEIFEILDKKGVEPPKIKIRKNATTSLSPRDKTVRKFQEQEYEDWKENQDYGKQWAVKGFFSAVKRCFSQTVTNLSAMLLPRVASLQKKMEQGKTKKAVKNQ